MPKQSQQLKLDALTKAIEKLIANPIAPVLPVAPVAPVLPIVQPNTGDHDLLMRLEENVTLNFKQVKDAIKELSDGTSKRIGDLEVLTDKHSNDLIMIKTWGTAGLLILGIAQFLISKFWN